MPVTGSDLRSSFCFPPPRDFFYLYNIYNKTKIMKKVIRLTESDLVRIVKRVINEETNLSSSNRKQFVLYTDSNLRNSIGTYLFQESDSAMGGAVFISLKPTSNSKYKCLESIKYRKPGMFDFFSGKISLTAGGKPGCPVPKILFTDEAGEEILNNE